MENVLVAMSGGVDSSVAAYLIKSRGNTCIGATMLLCGALPGCQPENTVDAQSVADRLGIPFHILNHRDAFAKKVVEPFIQSYEAGKTPNPCVTCNHHLKFGTLLEDALRLGCNHIATGHYAIVQQDPDSGRYLLYRATDKSKDQTYFLAGLTQHQLSHILFPLGELTKDQVRLIADEQGFLNAKKKDSQDICFIPDGDYVSFIKKYTGKEYPTGDYVNLEGKVLGQHAGAICYTIGQRKGLGIALGAPAYVCSKDIKKNTVTLGANEDLFRRRLQAENWNWIPFPDLKEPMRVLAKVRYRHTPQPATVFPEENGFATVEFDEPQRAITPGQAVVLYDGDLVIGSGTITNTL